MSHAKHHSNMVVYKMWFPRPADSESFGNLLEGCRLWPHPRAIESESQGMWKSALCFSKSLQVIVMPTKD